MGGDGRHEQLALGETPNIAARLEGLAQRNGIVIVPLTKALCGDVFRYDDLGELWRRGEYIPMTLDPELARAGSTGITKLLPAKEN